MTAKPVTLADVIETLTQVDVPDRTRADLASAIR